MIQMPKYDFNRLPNKLINLRWQILQIETRKHLSINAIYTVERGCRVDDHTCILMVLSLEEVTYDQT